MLSTFAVRSGFLLSKSVTAVSVGAVRCMSTRWAAVEMGPKDPILGVTEAFLADTDPNKLNLGVGAYRCDNGKPTVLKSVQTAQKAILEKGMNNEYAPIGGDQAFVNIAVEMAYGTNSAPLKEGRVAALQSLSGTGALRLCAAFIGKFMPGKTVYMSDPTWGNHFPIFEHAGVKTGKYPYYDPATKGLDIKGVLKAIADAPNGSGFVLHACAHNPTGVDPSRDQWKQISAAMKAKGHLVIMDSAYQGFATGDVDGDAFAIRQMVEDGHEIFVCQSFAKNFGLYGHRVGTVSVVCNSKEEKARVDSQLKILARAIYSNPPIQGARIVQMVLSDAALRKQWFADVKEMADRIIKMRALLKKGILDAGSKHNWDHVTNQIGMFCYSGLTPEQVDKLTNQHHIYLTRNGRISMAGVISKDIPRLAAAIHAVSK